ncbi:MULTISPECIES: TonB-dependent receptor family protein [Bradyrhizobium]|jgi:iron complex outermembrane recepter protein|uniref:TonB-dependent receptor family protein n=1 Tax=Bradyrhizobium TaxID=374 RepID=UPI00048023DA|nr:MULTISPECIES: TonB-dependent receptor [Bradyrhizobium]MCS3449685.1 iron complex outermembrane receptor protein [Bradyrhizobium elkanii]MCS3559172.1 iron complex outermembrane receptor protein [Bradyrhizobium elkanii]MCW2150982.1 iron complex outermembrane receptor protein [Bradyrhizobium elkanii]MCW2358972.1 iron complex outermembrane receptor protein [Bradyrhizobium elkanii]MCW2374713.1 iron complex outermembrane receptor protein [Bradyrhizobium elkanii]
MFRYHPLEAASVLALGATLCALPSAAEAQAPSTELPSVTVEAPRTAVRAKPAAQKPRVRAASVRRPPKPAAGPAVTAAPAAGATPGETLAAIRDGLNRAPTGQTQTTIDRSQFDNRPAFSVADVLRDSPGISIKQGNGPRDFGISIRGSNARNGFGIRNLVIFDDGFPVTQPDGLSRSDLIDPHAYGAIDVVRGPSSALYGNYATGGALNFRTRPGGTIDGVEYGVDGGSFGYLNNYLAAGKKVGNFEGSLFASDARGDGYIGNSWFNTQTVNFLGTLQVTPDDRFTVKLINNDLTTRLPIRSSLNQFYQNPFQQGCTTGATAAPGCATVTLFNNGFNAAAGTDRETAVQAGLGRDDRRTIVGGRWEHDFDNQTTWRNQFVFDDRNINQPTGSTSAIGDFPSYNYMSDVVRRGEIFGLDSMTYFGGFYNTLTASSDTRNVMPGGNATLGSLSSNLLSTTTNYGVRAREELKLTSALTAVAGIGWEATSLTGRNTAYSYAGAAGTTTTAITTADRQFQNTAPELALLYRLNSEWQFRGRVATGYGTPQVGNLFVLPSGASGNNTQLRTQKNLGYDVGADWTPNNALKLSVTGFYEFFKDELVSQATPLAGISYTFNAPRSEHRGVELAADWKFLPGWRFSAAYTYLDEVYTEYVENITNGAVFSFNRAGNKIPGISPNELTARLGYDQLSGPLQGLGGFVEVQWKDSFYMDNANLLKAPGYELVNLNLHYKTDLVSDYFKALNLYIEVRNVFDRTYVASANNISNSVTAAGIQNPASVLANSTNSIYAGSPRAFVAGMKIAFK